MMLMGVYVLFLAIFTAIGAALGYVAEASYPGSGSLLGIAVFLAALWAAWVAALRVSERLWPEAEKPSA